MANGITTTTKYLYFGGKRIALKQGNNVTYLHGDHLGSTSVTSGATVSRQTYYLKWLSQQPFET